MGKPLGFDPILKQEPKFCCEFEGCGKHFTKQSRLIYHQNIHLTEKPYKCDFEGCSSAYYRPNHLKRHVESAHKKNLPDEVKCEHEGCKAVFATKRSLYYHNKKMHSFQPLQCSVCDKEFSKKWMLKEHEAIHSGGKPFKCRRKSCNEKFETFKSFRAHKRAHLRKTLKCSIEGCNLIFDKWSEFINHKKSGHPPPETKCTICNKLFTKSTLKLHMLVHEENRTTFKCPVDGCPRFYLHARNLAQHIKVKHDGALYECSICEQKLCSKQKLELHTKIVHKSKKKKKKKRDKSAINILMNLKPMTHEEWEPKRTGPARHVREKSMKGFSFPADPVPIKQLLNKANRKVVPEEEEKQSRPNEDLIFNGISIADEKCDTHLAKLCLVTA